MKISPFGSKFIDSDKFLDAFSTERIKCIPHVNIMENDKEYMIELGVPGLKKSDFTIYLEGDLLTISAQNESKEIIEYAQQEFNYNSFSRSFIMPENIKKEDVKAKYENGILLLHVSKKKHAKLNIKKEIAIS